MDGVSTSSIVSMFFTLLVSFLVPILLWIYFARKAKRLSSAVIAGAVGFVLPQMIIRIPILQLLAGNEAWVSFCQNNVVLSLSIYAFTAALFETMGRLLVFGVILRKRLSYYTSLGAGIGHGGIEAIGLIGLSYINNIVLSFMMNAGTLPSVSGIENAVSVLSTTPATHFLLAGAERIFTLPLQMMLSVVICFFITKRKVLLGVLVCISIHFAIDFFIPLLSVNQISLWIIEGIMLVIAVISIMIMKTLKHHFEKIDIPKDPAEIALEEGY